MIALETAESDPQLIRFEHITADSTLIVPECNNTVQSEPRHAVAWEDRLH